ncbi:MAG: hypothetical protein ACJ74T_04170 [Pyrinomonadaceae bacterium]
MRDARLSKGHPAAAWLCLAVLLLFSTPAPAHARASNPSSNKSDAVTDTSACANLKEQIPGQYRGRYERWKAMFLSADSGRQLWLRYACNPAFRLTISVSERMDKGGGTKLEDYQWDEGRLTAATIILGHRIDRGYPDSVYYPVLSSLYYLRVGWDAGEPDNILAAAKFAHEFGHVDQAAKADPALFQLQNQLSQVYARRFTSNGYDASDPALADMADRMGGEPMILSGQREYWAETYALRYLLSRLRPGKRRVLLRSVRKALASESSAYYLPSRTEWQTLASFN